MTPGRTRAQPPSLCKVLLRDRARRDLRRVAGSLGRQDCRLRPARDGQRPPPERPHPADVSVLACCVGPCLAQRCVQKPSSQHGPFTEQPDTLLTDDAQDPDRDLSRSDAQPQRPRQQRLQIALQGSSRLEAQRRQHHQETQRRRRDRQTRSAACRSTGVRAAETFKLAGVGPSQLHGFFGKPPLRCLCCSL